MICTQCKEEGTFSTHNKICNCCRGKANKPVKPSKNRKAMLKSLYGITIEDWDNLYERQGGVCAICCLEEIQNRRLAVDHCHYTGVVRGLLCQACNTGIGKLKDDPRLLRRAIDYIERRP